jgi:trehalose-phosphatase
MSDAHAIPSALERVAEIGLRAAGRRLALFLDYDGTLTPIVGRPEDAILAPEMQRRLERLAGHLPVAVVSGRDLEDVRGRVGVDGITYAGSHGLDIRGPGIRHDAGADAARAVSAVAATLERELPDVPGLLVERKRFGVSVHYRLVDPAAVPAIEAVVRRVVDAAEGLRRRDGAMVFEVQPDVPWDKGRAVEALLAVLGASERLHPVYVGDDRTDEDAFRVLVGTGTGIVVWTAPRPTAARYWLADPSEVGRFLDALASRV